MGLELRLKLRNKWLLQGTSTMDYRLLPMAQILACLLATAWSFYASAQYRLRPCQQWTQTFQLANLLLMSPQNTNTQWRHESKKSEKFGPNVADKCPSTITRNLGWRCNSWPWCADNFLIMHSSSPVCIHFLICYPSILGKPINSESKDCKASAGTVKRW